jgi:hypothetical protein
MKTRGKPKDIKPMSELEFGGKLYHELGREKIDWRGDGDKVLKPENWNRYEILAVDHSIWLALNGQVISSINDPLGELEGKIALGIHSGPPQKVEYKIIKLIHDPEIKLENQSSDELMALAPEANVNALKVFLPSHGGQFSPSFLS